MKWFTLTIGLLLTISSYAFDPTPINNESFLKIVNELGLDSRPVPFSVLEDQIVDTVGNEVYHEITIQPYSLEPIHLSMKTPLDLSRPLPVIIVLSGFGTGRKSLDLINSIGDNIVISYDYPLPINLEKVSVDLGKLKQVTGHLSAIFNWLSALNYVDKYRINILGVSFGTLFIPFSQRVLQYQNFVVRTTTLSFGGVNICAILEPQLNEKFGPLLTSIILQRLWPQIQDYEPMNHLSFLTGRFLIVHAEEEQIFPLSSRELQWQLTPEIKTRLIMKGPHIAPDRPDLIEPFVNNLKTWLRNENAIN